MGLDNNEKEEQNPVSNNNRTKEEIREEKEEKEIEEEKEEKEIEEIREEKTSDNAVVLSNDVKSDEIK